LFQYCISFDAVVGTAY